ncbi:Catechol 2,3-dioxygenase [Sediminibacillus halophilus]|uniref:Catechol 2,3-dioxygenase n=1 Tax=Sediminibacillus halophilus TaxID=482461 RepID=A0A1G9LNS2_9BACI|nr:Catechol 2,3-dioxygenase [Sediminibacillus halophilus]
MDNKLIRVGTTYLPVADVNIASEWYVTNLDADLSYKDEEKAIINLADQSFFLVKAGEKQTANFLDTAGKERFSITFEVDGIEALQAIRQQLKERGAKVGAIEDRGHPGNNFTFYDLDGNKFDVWSELSPVYKNSHSLLPSESGTGSRNREFEQYLESYLDAWRNFSLEALQKHISNDYQAREARGSEVVDFGYQQSLEGWEQAFKQLKESAEWVLTVHAKISTGENVAIAIISATLIIEGKPLDTANLFFDVFQRKSKQAEWKMVRSYIEAGIPCKQLQFVDGFREIALFEKKIMKAEK